MSIRYTGMYVPSGGVTTIAFTTKSVQITGVAFNVNPQRIVFTLANLDINGVSFSVVKGPTNQDNGFMIF